jgi:hypothetical protein
MDKIVISKKAIADLTGKAGALLFKKSAEDELLKLLKIKDEIDLALSEVKEAIMKSGKEVSPDFNGVIGKRLKCVVRKYGDRYKFQEGCDPKYVKEIVIRRANGDSIDQEIEATGKLPTGIVEVEREEKLTIIVPKENDTTIGQISD